MTAFTLATNIIAQRRALDGSAPAEHEEEEGEGADVMCTSSENTVIYELMARLH